MVAEKDKVVVFVTSRGTHRGEYVGVPPTGRSLEWTLIDLYHAISLLGQMGVL